MTLAQPWPNNSKNRENTRNFSAKSNIQFMET